MTIGDRIKQRRELLGISAESLAVKVGVSRSTMFRYENGSINKIPVNILSSIAAALYTTSAYLSGEETLSDRINKAILNSGLSYGELSEVTKIPKSILHSYTTGETEHCPLEHLEAIAIATKTSVNFILGYEGISLPSPTTTEDYVTFPVIGEIAAGYDKIAAEDWTGETVDIPTSYLKGRAKDEFFVLTVSGDSMYPLYHNGDKVLVLKQTTLNRPGDVGAIIYEDEKATLKRISYVPGEDWLELIPINPEFKPQRIEGEELEHCRVIGIPRLLIREIN